MTDSRYDPHDGGTTTEPKHYDLSSAEASQRNGDARGPSALEMLRQLAEDEASAIEEDEAKPLLLHSPKETVRILCSRVLSDDQISNAQRLALPRKERNRPIPRMGLMRSTDVQARLIAEQAREIHVRASADDEWKRINGPDGEALGLDDPTLLAYFGTADPIAAVRRIWPRDHFLLAAGQKLLAGCGYAEDDDAEDPQ